MLKFFKMHVLGNNFMVLDLISQDSSVLPEQIKSWANSKTGIGFDQLLTISPPENPEHDFFYRVYNADGSQAEQCGNGALCISKLVKHLGLSNNPTLELQTINGAIQTLYKGPSEIEVDMGEPNVDSISVPFLDDLGQKISEETFLLQLETGEHEVTPISFGNPHGVIFVRDIKTCEVELIGEQLSRHKFFPSRANIGFCQIQNASSIALRVYERGVGETLACGTGACAAVVAGRLKNTLKSSVSVELPGVKLEVSWLGKNYTVKLSGPATLVYEGVIHQ